MAKQRDTVDDVFDVGIRWVRWRAIARQRRSERIGLSRFGRNSSDAIRRHADASDNGNLRMAFARDADRIIHCDAYARYFDKTQVFFMAGNDHVTRRILHVQMVARIARTIARCIGANEDLAEAIALGHDVGHTPFGHAGEEYLAAVLERKQAGSFVHNAQSVRWLDRLEKQGDGLNLTLEVLDGILGHNGEMLDKPELHPDSAKLTWERLDADVTACLTRPRSEKADRAVFPSTLEGCIVRVSDVIAYVGRDVEDAIRVGLITESDLPSSATEVLGSSNAQIISALATDAIHHSYGKSNIAFSLEKFEALRCLKRFNESRIYQHESLKRKKEDIREAIDTLFDRFYADLKAGGEDSLIFKHHIGLMHPDYMADTTPARVVADYIAGMTDRYMEARYREVDGTSLSWVLTPEPEVPPLSGQADELS